MQPRAILANLHTYSGVATCIHLSMSTLVDMIQELKCKISDYKNSYTYIQANKSIASSRPVSKCSISHVLQSTICILNTKAHCTVLVSMHLLKIIRENFG